MGASQDKRKRQNERAEGIEKHQVAARKKKEKLSKAKLKYSIVGAVVGVCIAAVLILNTNLFYTGTTAVAIGNQRYNTAEFNYYYTMSYYNYVNSYGEYISYFFDTSQPLRKQEYGSEEFKTWADYFKAQALETMKGVTAIYEKALAEGAGTLSREKLEEIDESMEEYAYYAEIYGYPSVNNYLASVYGRGCSEKVIRGILTKSAIAADYAISVSESFTFDQNELTNWYEENKDTYDRITYTYYYVSSDIFDLYGYDYDEEGEDGDHDHEAEKAAAMAQAKMLAEDVAAGISDEESFETTVEGLAGSGPYTVTNAGGDVAYSDYADWLLADERKTGDVTVTESDSGYYVLLFGGRDDNSYNTVSVRHILIKAEEDEDGEFTDEAKKAALLEAERLLEEWRSGEATEESFAELATLMTDDDGSRENGGLYEDIYKGMMVEEFDGFCFGPRAYGDTAVVYGENDYYAGYHIMFFSGEGEVYRDMLADARLRNEAYSEWERNLLEPYYASEKFPLVFRKKI
ncbi:MAG: peptidyl-prolyl cis-trans isomerase [Oscillospiraceae bacterium]|nr:peptidyl-prolyl cis-trans isomerase [Oscillospiraceae bacterium]